MVDVAAAVKAAEELDKCVGIVAKLVGKLKTQPDLAAQKLGQALLEVAKTLQVVDDAVTSYLSLGIDQGGLDKSSKRLLEIEGGGLSTEVRRGLGHCGQIGRIHWTYLDKWFKRTFDPEEYDEISHVFVLLESADGGLFDVLARVAQTLEREANAVLDLVLKNDESAARQRVLLALSDLRPLRKTISSAMQRIYSLQNEFADMTQVVP